MVNKYIINPTFKSINIQNANENDNGNKIKNENAIKKIISPKYKP